MDNFFNRTVNHIANQVRFMRGDIQGTTAPGFCFSLSGLGIAGVACFMLLDLSFNIHSSTFADELLKALSLF
jgi:hypothetical protein